MDIQKFELNQKIARDSQVMREGSDIDALYDDLTPLSGFLKSALKVILTFSAGIALPLVLTALLADPEAVELESTDSLMDMALKIVSQYSEVEFLWGVLVGLLLTVGLMHLCIQVFRFRRKRGWSTVSTAYELESLFAIRPIFGLPTSKQPLDAINDRKSEISEAMMSFETLLNDSFDGGLPKTIVVSSSLPSEGKSTLAICLATTIARTGKQVLLVDADLRYSGLSRYLGGQNTGGLVEYLSDQAEAEAHETDFGFDVIYSGQSPPNSAELLRRENLALLLSEMSQAYDHIILDTPPVLGLVDAVRVARLSDLVIYALEANRTWVYQALGSIRRLGANLQIVPVVTKIPTEQSGYSFGYGYGYEYSYGDDAA